MIDDIKSRSTHRQPPMVTHVYIYSPIPILEGNINTNKIYHHILLLSITSPISFVMCLLCYVLLCTVGCSFSVVSLELLHVVV